MFTRNNKRKCELRTYSNEIQTYRERSSKLFSGYLWLHRPHKSQKWKRVYTSLYNSPSLTYLVWWSNKHETQIRGFLLLNDFDVVHYLANSICIKPNGSVGVQVVLKADNVKDSADWIAYLREFSSRHRTRSNNRCSLTDEEESVCEDNSRTYSSSTSITNNTTVLERSELERLQNLITWTYRCNGIISQQ